MADTLPLTPVASLHPTTCLRCRSHSFFSKRCCLRRNTLNHTNDLLNHVEILAPLIGARICAWKGLRKARPTLFANKVELQVKRPNIFSAVPGVMVPVTNASSNTSTQRSNFSGATHKFTANFIQLIVTLAPNTTIACCKHSDLAGSAGKPKAAHISSTTKVIFIAKPSR